LTGWTDKKGFVCEADCSAIMKHELVTEKIIQAFYKVYNTLGYGFLEKVNENAMAIELASMGFKVEKQKRIQVYYFGYVVGDYCADMVIDEIVTIELKANEILVEANENQLVNYLKATNIKVGLLLNLVGSRKSKGRFLITIKNQC
jgi:GxxExxY protein